MEENILQPKFLDQNTILYEYEAIVENLKEELSNCKVEQKKLRLEIETLRKENQDANETIRNVMTSNNHERCNDIASDKEAFTNLEKRVTILQMEKDSVFQLWQMALKTIDILEEELKNVHKEGKSTKFYQEQVNSIKESYSEAIMALDLKLQAAKENFFKQQALWEKSKEKIDELMKEKNDIFKELNNCKQTALEQDRSHQASVNSLKESLSQTKVELKHIQHLKTDLEEKLKKAQKLANAMLSKDMESKNKVSEAVILIEAAVKEKEEALQREVFALKEKERVETSLAKLEKKFSELSNEYTERLEKQVVKAKEVYNNNLKRYLAEIKELKAELREKSTLLDRAQRESKLAEEELERLRLSSDNFVQRARISSFEQILQDKAFKLQINEESHKPVYDDRIQYLEQQISHLQDKLSNTSDKLRRIQMQNSRDVEDHLREADSRTREILERCTNFEKQLSRALIDKENLISNLNTLEMSFEKEMQKRNHEKLLLETKVRDLQEKINNSESIINVSLTDRIINRRNIGQQTSMNLESVTNILVMQEKFEKKTKELTQHVETHQQLSNKWKEEANLLATKFQKRSQELKIKINVLQKQNEELSRELLFYQQLLARCNAQLVQNFTKESETR